MPKAILIDLDDTILGYGRETGLCWQEACAEAAREVPGLDPAALWAAIDAVRAWYWSDPGRHRRGRLGIDWAREEIVAAALDRLGVAEAGLAGRIARAYGSQRDGSIQPLPGAVEALHTLKQRGLRLALLTNGAALVQWAKIDRFALAPFFDCIVVEGEFGAGKPDERVYRHALKQIGAGPAEAWMAGDNLDWDVGGAQRLGIRGIWIDAAGSGLPADSAVRPDAIVRALAELPGLLPE